MASASPLRLWRGFLALDNDRPAKILGMAFLMSGACATVVTLSAVALKPLREANAEAARKAHMLEMLRSRPGLSDALAGTRADAVTMHVVELESGTLRPELDPGSLTGDAEVAIPEQHDLARLGTRPARAVISLVGEAERPSLVVLPVYGRGYQSMLRGYLVLKADLDTIAALTFYEQGETPGVGARITEPQWLSRFAGKRAFGDDGEVALAVVPQAHGPHQVDAIGGATRSCRGVDGLIRYWLGPHGFGPFLARLKERRR